MTANERVLLQVEYFVASRLELLPGLILKVEGSYESQINNAKLKQ